MALFDDDGEEDPPGFFEEPVEPGNPTVENAVFVLLGVLGTLLVLLRFLGVL